MSKLTLETVATAARHGFIIPASLSREAREKLLPRIPPSEPPESTAGREKRIAEERARADAIGQSTPRFIRITSPGKPVFVGSRSCQHGEVLKVNEITRRINPDGKAIGPPSWWAEHVLVESRAKSLMLLGYAVECDEVKGAIDLMQTPTFKARHELEQQDRLITMDFQGNARFIESDYARWLKYPAA
jgi:hypothetical protein